jgi:hypothetical protein
MRKSELGEGHDPSKFKEFAAEKSHGAPPCGSKAIPIFVTRLLVL